MPPSVLYLAPSFLSYRRHKPLRGVQLFDLVFAPDLARLGHDVTVPADLTWRERLKARFADAPANLKVHYTPPLLKPLWNGLTLAATLHRRFDVTFIGNPAKGLMPVLGLLRRRGLTGKLVLQANRPPIPSVAAKLRDWNVTLTAVSQTVADQFPLGLAPNVHVYYGIADHTLYHPPASRPDDGLVHFGLVGKLDNAWKGADRAVAAFARLPEDIRRRARLHLASYTDGRRIDDPCVVCHPWRPAEEMPAFLRTLDVMLTPSFGVEETFSQAMVQGMLTGHALISSDLPVLAEKLDTGGGIVVPGGPEDADSLAAAMTRLVREPQTRRTMGAIARRTALDRYVWDSAEFARRFLAP